MPRYDNFICKVAKKIIGVIKFVQLQPLYYALHKIYYSTEFSGSDSRLNMKTIAPASTSYLPF